MKTTTTIQWLIEQSEIKGLYYLAGEKGSQNHITGINVMDNPDTLPWLKKNELILSTGYLFSSTKLYKTIITDLSARGCAGLGIKMHRYLSELPPEMLKQANQLNFPVFSLPFTSTMEELTNLVYRNIFSAEISETQKAAALYKDITEAALKKRSLPAILKKLAQAVRAPVFLTTVDFQVIELALPRRSRCLFPFPFCDTGNTLFPSYTVINLKALFAEKVFPVQQYEIKAEQTAYRFHIFPLSHSLSISGYLIFHIEEHEFTGLDFNLINNIMPVVHIILMNNSLFKEEQNSRKSLFYNNIFTGRLKTAAELEPACSQNGFPCQKHRTCIVLRMDTHDTLTIARRRIFEQNIRQCISDVLNEQKIDFTITIYHTDIIVFLFHSGFISQTAAAFFAGEKTRLLKKHLHQEGFTGKAGISLAYQGAETIKKGYDQASAALELGSRLHPGDKIYSYQDDYILHNLSSAYTHERMLELYNEILGSLICHDQETNQELVKTLAAFLANGLNASKTAGQLYIHRNTMNYRLEQIEKLLGISLHDSSAIFQIQLALYLKILLEL